MILDFATLAPLVAILVVAGGAAGLLAGLLGVGGGILLVPAFYFAFVSLGFGGAQVMQICLATSLATIIVTSIRSVLAHNRKGAVDWDILKGWAPGIGIGALVGVYAASRLSSDMLEITFGVLAGIVGLYFAFGRDTWRLGAAMPKGVKRAAISPAIGFLSTLMGIGGGSFGVPLMSLHGVPMHRAVATSAGFGLLIAVPSVLGFLTFSIANPPPLSVGAVNLPAFLVAIAMTLITAPIGARLAHRLQASTLRRVFAVFILFVSANMIRQALFG